MNNSLKQELRRQYLIKLKNLDINTKTLWDKEIFNKFINSDYFRQNQTFALYWSLNHEVNTHDIIETLLKNNKKVCLPRIKEKELVFYYISDVSELIIDNKFGIAQPPITNVKVNVQNIEIFIIPLVAYDKKNHRIGYGGGFYDYFLSHNHNVITIGLGYKIQLIENINYQSDKWDIPLFSILTNE